MAAATITATSVPQSMAGLNLTDASFSTLVAGGSNGVKFLYDAKDVVVLKNDTGGAAVFTVSVTTPSSFSSYSITVTAPTITVANNKTYLLRLADVFKDADGYITITCDVAGKCLVLDL